MNTGNDFLKIGVAIGVLSAVTLLLPPYYGKWFPWIILAGYGALHPQTVNSALTSIGIGPGASFQLLDPSTWGGVQPVNPLGPGYGTVPIPKGK